MILIGITGTNGSGKGETVWETVARGCRHFRTYEKVSYNLNSDCKTPVPEQSK